MSARLAPTAAIAAMAVAPSPGLPTLTLPPQRVRTLLIGLIAFVTVVDLFAAQAILPGLAQAYGVSAAAMGLAVNASTIGMAVAGLAVALLGRGVDRRRGIVTSLVLLGLPTLLLAWAPDLLTFTTLRIIQGLCMASAFTLTLAYLGEHCGPGVAASAFAAYVAGNVASNLFGRLLAAAVADRIGLGPSFLAMAALNVGGAALVAWGLTHGRAMVPMPLVPQSPLATLRRHLGNARLRAAYLTGACILFAFIGTFTFVGFVLARAPIGLDQAALGLVYLVFVPSIVTTPMAGKLVRAMGVRRAIATGFLVALGGLPFLVQGTLVPILAGLTLVAIGTFLAQAVATGFVAVAAEGDRGAASGLYLASYFGGGLVGSLVLGRVFDAWGWSACVAGIGLALLSALALATRLTVPARP